MTDPFGYAILMLLCGAVALLAVPVQQVLRRFGLPGLVAFSAPCFAFPRLADRRLSRRLSAHFARLVAGRRTGRPIGASMIPRAEIGLIVMLQGPMLGAWAMPREAFTAAVVLAAGTCIVGPLDVQRQLRGPADRAETA